MAIVKPDDNLHTIGGVSLWAGADAKYREYRRQWRENPCDFIVADFPLFLDIEVTSRCNLKCPFCATTYRGKKITRGDLSYELLKKIIDEGAGQGLYGVKFNIRGEPCMHPELDKFVKYAKEKGLIDVYFNTNALLLTEALSRKLIDAGLDRISISIEGYSKEVYEKYRVGGKFATLMRNLETLIAEKTKAGVTHPRIRIQSIMIPELVDDLDNYKNHWETYADEVAYLDFKVMKQKKKSETTDWVCPELWQRMGIFWDGTILPCNHDDDGLLQLGNAATDRIRDCWHSPRLTEIRELHKQCRAHEIDACDGCYLRDSEMRKLR